MIAAVSVRVLIATLGLLALATSAHAECAWVLWAESRVITSNATTVGTISYIRQRLTRANRNASLPWQRI